MDNLDSYSEYEFMKKFIEPVVNQHVKKYKEELLDLKKSFQELSNSFHHNEIGKSSQETNQVDRLKKRLNKSSESHNQLSSGIRGYQEALDKLQEAASINPNDLSDLEEFITLADMFQDGPSLQKSAGVDREAKESFFNDSELSDPSASNFFGSNSFSEGDTYIEVEFTFPSSAHSKEEKSIDRTSFSGEVDQNQESLNTQRLENIYGKAQEAYLQQNFDDASNICFFLTIVEPEHPEFWLGLGLSEHMRGNFELAAYAFANSMDISKEDLFPAIFAAKSLLSLGQKDGAKVLLGKAIDHAGNNPSYADFKQKAVELKNSI